MINFKLAEIMGRKRITQKMVSEGTGIRPNTISDMWHGETRRIDIDNLNKLCKFLECQPGDLIEFVSDENLNKDV